MGAITEKQKRFADEWLVDLNGTRAYKAAYPSVKKDETASGDGWDVVIGNAEKIPTGGYVVPAQAISANGAHGEENIVLAQAISANVYLGDKEATI